MLLEKHSRQACTPLLFIHRGVARWSGTVSLRVMHFLQPRDSTGRGFPSGRGGSVEVIRTGRELNSPSTFVDQARYVGHCILLPRSAVLRRPGVFSLMFSHNTDSKGAVGCSGDALQHDRCCSGAERARHDKQKSSSQSVTGMCSPFPSAPGWRKPSFSSSEKAPHYACCSVPLPAGRPSVEKPTSQAVARPSAPFPPSNDAAVTVASTSLALPKVKPYQYDQRRYVRPNRGRNDYQRVGGKKRGRGVEALPETLDLLMKAQDAEATTAVMPTGTECLSGLSPLTRPGVPITEAMAVPTVAEVNAPLPLRRPSAASTSTSAHQSTEHENKLQDASADRQSYGEHDFPHPCSTQSRGRLDSVALHVGDVSRLRVDATVFGASPSLSVSGSGRGFVGCSSLIAGAGPMLPVFVSQQREALTKAGTRPPAKSAVAVSTLREGVARLVQLSSQDCLKPSMDKVSPEDVYKLPAAALSALAASAARQFVARHKAGTFGADAHVKAGSLTSVVAPTRLLPPGAVLLSPGFSLPSAFLVHVVEPNAVYSSEHFFRTLVRTEELEAAQRRNGPAMTSQSGEDDWNAIDDKIEKRLLRSCWERMQTLEDCYVQALNAAAALGVRSLAVPCLGAGVGRFPAYIAARCAARAVGRWMKEHKMTEKEGGQEDPVPNCGRDPAIERVVFCTTSDKEWKALRQLIPAFCA